MPECSNRASRILPLPRSEGTRTIYYQLYAELSQWKERATEVKTTCTPLVDLRDEMTSNLVIRGGLVADGLGAELVKADVHIVDDVIAAVGPAEIKTTSDILDASGLVVAPGFVDTHTHSDALPFLGSEFDDLRLGSLRQGVTTEIAGNCGFSLFPTPPGEAGVPVTRHLESLFGPGVRTAASITDYATALRQAPMAANLVSLVGQGTLRAAVVGFDRCPATAEELSEMTKLADDAMAAGAAGLSTGLLYPPGSYAPTEEIIALARIAARHSRPYVSHIRNEMDGVVDALKEALAIGATSGAAVHISHLKAGGRENHGKLPELLAILEEARYKGQDVTADIYPYTAGSTVLHALLPPWATEGGTANMLERVRLPAVRERIRSEFAKPPESWQNFLAGGSWDDVTIASSPAHPEVEGTTVTALAARSGIDEIDAVCNLLIDEMGAVTVIVEMAAFDDMETCLAWPHTTVGSDGIPIPGKPHPRWAGSFARVLGRHVRDRHLIGLVEGIRKMTSLAAQRFALEGRGQLRPGAVGDIVVFDADQIVDNATYSQPLAPPSHVRHVVVNGVPVIRDTQDTGARPGRFLSV